MDAGNAKGNGVVSKFVYMATLIRGRVYFHKRVKFERQVPKEVNAEQAEALAELVEELQDNDPESSGSRMAKPLFKIERVRRAEMTAHKFTSPKGQLAVKPRPLAVHRVRGA